MIKLFIIAAVSVYYTNDIRTGGQFTGSGAGLTGIPVSGITQPGTIITNGHSAAVTVSNNWTFKDAANAQATITNGVFAGAGTFTTITNAAATASTIPVYDANKKTGSLANGGNNTVLHGTTPPAYSAVSLSADVTGSLAMSSITQPGTIITNGATSAHTVSNTFTIDAGHHLIATNNISSWAGNTGSVLTAAAVTNFYALNGNSVTNVAGTDTTAWTRTLMTRTTTLQNLYILLSAAPGASRTTTVTILTNGVASNLEATATASGTTGNDTTHFVTIAAGTEVGIRIVTVTSATASRISWGVEGRSY